MTDTGKAGIVTLIEARAALVTANMPAAATKVDELINNHLTEIGYDGSDSFIEQAQKIWAIIRPE